MNIQRYLSKLRENKNSRIRFLLLMLKKNVQSYMAITSNLLWTYC